MPWLWGEGPIETAILQELRRGPRTLAQLHERIYGTPADGGPSEKAIQDRISSMRRFRGYEIKRVSLYSLG